MLPSRLVLVAAPCPNGEFSVGTGHVVTDRHVLTAAHVLGEATTVQVPPARTGGREPAVSRSHVSDPGRFGRFCPKEIARLARSVERPSCLVSRVSERLELVAVRGISSPSTGQNAWSWTRFFGLVAKSA